MLDESAVDGAQGSFHVAPIPLAVAFSWKLADRCARVVENAVEGLNHFRGDGSDFRVEGEDLLGDVGRGGKRGRCASN